MPFLVKAVESCSSVYEGRGWISTEKEKEGIFASVENPWYLGSKYLLTLVSYKLQII